MSEPLAEHGLLRRKTGVAYAAHKLDGTPAVPYDTHAYRCRCGAVCDNVFEPSAWSWFLLHCIEVLGAQPMAEEDE